MLAPSGCSCEAPPPAPLTFVDGCSPLLHDVDCGVPYPNDYFLVDDAKTRNARLALSAAAQQVLQNALALLGVSAPETM